MSTGADIRWSEDFRIVDVEQPVSALLAWLRWGGPRYIVLRRAPDLLYVFLLTEVQLLLKYRSSEDRPIQEVIKFHDGDSSQRVRPDGTLLEYPYSMPQEPLPSRGRYVKVNDRLEPIAVGRSAAEHSSPFVSSIPPAEDDSLEPPIPLRGRAWRRAAADEGDLDEGDLDAHRVTVEPEEDGDGVSDEPSEPRDEARADEGRDPVRYPSIAADRQLVAGQPVAVTVDLLRSPSDPETRSVGVTIQDLPDDWSEIEIAVEIVTSAIDFEQATGTIRVRRNRDSVAAHFTGVVRASLSAEQPITVVALFSYEGRDCGMARRSFVVGQSLAEEPDEQAAPLVVERTAKAPDLTVRILRPDPSAPGKLIWTLTVPRADDVPGLPDRLDGTADLGSRPEDFAAALYKALAAAPVGKHKELFLGLGKKLWLCTPEVFRRAYWALLAVRPGFTIQIVTDEPFIPWELMRPEDEGTGRARDILALEHPVARWIGQHAGSLRQRLPDGRVVTIAPSYRKVADQLKHAQEEARLLREQYQAEAVPGTVDSVDDLLCNGLAGQPVAVIHFAGHGTFSLPLPDTSTIKLEDGLLAASEVGRSEVKLGERDGPLVVFNACEVGATGASLGATGGWAATFIERRFRGFVAPLWPVYDDHAVVVIRELFEAMVQRREPLGEALQQIRKKHVDESPTFLAYLYYGDVLACMPPRA